MTLYEAIAATSSLDCGTVCELLAHPRASSGCVLRSEIVEIEEVPMVEVEVSDDIVEVEEYPAVDIEEIETDEDIEEISEESIDGIC